MPEIDTLLPEEEQKNLDPVAENQYMATGVAVQVMPTQVGQQGVQIAIVIFVEQLRDPLRIAQITPQLLAPRRSTLKNQGRVERIRAIVEPLLQGSSTRIFEGFFESLAVLQDVDVPIDQLKHLADAFNELILDHDVQALTVVINHPPHVAQVLLPTFEHRLENTALVQLGIAYDGNHPTRPVTRVAPSFQCEIVLNERSKNGHRHAEAHRACRDVHLIGVLGARRVSLCTPYRAEQLQAAPALSSN